MHKLCKVVCDLFEFGSKGLEFGSKGLEDYGLSFIFNFLSEIISTVHEGESLRLVRKVAMVRHLLPLLHPMQQSLLTESRGHMGLRRPLRDAQQLPGPERSATHTLFPRDSSTLSQCLLVCPSRIWPLTDRLQKCLQ